MGQIYVGLIKINFQYILAGWAHLGPIRLNLDAKFDIPGSRLGYCNIPIAKFYERRCGLSRVLSDNYSAACLYWVSLAWRDKINWFTDTCVWCFMSMFLATPWAVRIKRVDFFLLLRVLRDQYLSLYTTCTWKILAIINIAWMKC